MEQPPITEFEEQRLKVYDELLARVLLHHHFVERTMRSVLLGVLARPDEWALNTVDELLARVPVGWRLERLRRVLADRGIPAEPTIGDLRALDEVRNAFAHSGPVVMWPGDDPEGELLLLVSFRRGGMQEKRFTVPEVLAVLDAAKRADDTLRTLLDG